MTSSGCFSTVFLLIVSPQIPLGSKRLFTQRAYVQSAMLHISSVHLHQVPSLRSTAELFAHLKDSHDGEQVLTCANTCTTSDHFT